MKKIKNPKGQVLFWGTVDGKLIPFEVVDYKEENGQLVVYFKLQVFKEDKEEE